MDANIVHLRCQYEQQLLIVARIMHCIRKRSRVNTGNLVEGTLLWATARPGRQMAIARFTQTQTLAYWDCLEENPVITVCHA